MAAQAAGRRNKRKAGTEAVLADRRRSINADYAARHPAKAAEERALRKAQHALQRDYGHKRHGTPETHAHAARQDQGALHQLYVRGVIDQFELADADLIAAIADRIGAELQIRTVSLETRVDRSPRAGGAFYEALGWVRAEMAYSRWRQPCPSLSRCWRSSWATCRSARPRPGIGSRHARPGGCCWRRLCYGRDIMPMRFARSMRAIWRRCMRGWYNLPSNVARSLAPDRNARSGALSMHYGRRKCRNLSARLMPMASASISTLPMVKRFRLKWSTPGPRYVKAMAYMKLLTGSWVSIMP